MCHIYNKLALFLALLVCVVGPVPATDRFVATTGTDSGTCTPVGSACATVQYAISQMADGDTTYVADGTYTTGITSNADMCSWTRDTHIVITHDEDCPVSGCTIRATNITDPPSVIFDGAELGFAIDGTVDSGADSADGWTLRGLHFTPDERGFVACYLDDFTLQDTVVEVPTGEGPRGYIQSADNVLLDNVSIYNTGKPCEILANASDYGLTLRWTEVTTIQDSYIGHVRKLLEMDYAQNVTIKRTHFQHWMNHGVTMHGTPNHDNGKDTEGVLIENCIFGGTTKEGCLCLNRNPGSHPDTDDCATNGPRAVDIYEATDVVVRNNTFVGHDYTPQSAMNNYGDNQDNAKEECTQDFCTQDGIKFYNNIVYDLVQDGGAAAERYLSTKTVEPTWGETDNFRYDGNIYFGGTDEWRCPGGDASSWVNWQATTCADVENHNPDQSSYNISPTFVDYAGEDYRPTVKSSQVDAGVDGNDADGDAKCASEDFDGNARSDGDCDIGAFEYVGVAEERRVIVVN